MGWCFRVPPFNRHSFAAPVSGRSARDCCAIGGLMRRNAVPSFAAPCGHFASLVRSSSTARLPSESFALLRRIWRPVQHHRHPSRSSAWFRGASRQGIISSLISHYSSPISHLHYSNPQIILIICGCFRKLFGIIDARKRRILCI